MAISLDDRQELLAIDIHNGLHSIEEMGSQIKQVWEETRSLSFPDSYKQVESVVVAGMGGSAYGTHVIQSLFKEQLTVPVFSIPDYTLPQWVNSKTLVILSSYSGSTEETLAAGEDALRKGALITGLTSGGKVAEFLKTHSFPGYVFKPTFNPCNTPRYALGYSVFGQMALLARMGLLELSESMYQEVLESIAAVQLRVSAAVSTQQNTAKLLAYECVEKIPVVVVAEQLEGAGHVVANAFNETAKTYSEYRVVPELNHHLMEGLKFPNHNDNVLLFLVVDSPLYSEANRKRMHLTQQVIEQNKCEVRTIELMSTTPIGQVFELLMFGTYTAFYLAFINGQDPVPNPWVDWFKAAMKKG